MKEFIKQDFLNNSCNDFNSQPQWFKQIIAESFEENYNWKIQFYDYFWEPLIFSHKDKAFYNFQNNKITQTSFKSQNDLLELNLSDFNQKFNWNWDVLVSNFENKAYIENNMEFLLDENTLEKYFLSLIKDFKEEEKDEILKIFELQKLKSKAKFLENWLSVFSKTLFLAIKSIENWWDFKTLIDVLENNIQNKNELFDLYLVALREELSEEILKLINEKFKNLDNKSWLFYQEFLKILKYLNSDIFNLPPKVKLKLQDLKKLKELKEKI